ncbi:hypothetical protein HDR60_02860 [bacterium]|nr:hypothetical protein [bacterium]
MKLNNKILYLTATGLISTLIPANTNAQTFYQCMPITCEKGYTLRGDKCCPDSIPENATPNENDCKWTCKSGYTKGNKSTLTVEDNDKAFNFCCEDSKLPANAFYEGGCSVYKYYYNNGCSTKTFISTTSESCFFGCLPGYHMTGSTAGDGSNRKIYSCVSDNNSSSSSSSWVGKTCQNKCDGEYTGCTCPSGTRCYNGYCQTR